MWRWLMHLHLPQTKLQLSVHSVSAIQETATYILYELATVVEMPVYTLDPGLSYFQFQVFFSNNSTHSQKSRHEPDSSKL